MVARDAAARRGDVGEDHGEGFSPSEGSSEALELDRLIHERVRLGIVSALAVNGSLRFTDLRDLLGITDGNLKSHANRLEAARYIECAKSFEGNGPKTEYSLTRTGREELQAYLGHMEAIIRATRDATEQ